MEIPEGEAKGNMAVFIIIGILLLIFPGVVVSVRLCLKKKLPKGQRALLIVMAWVQIVTVSLSYYIGDNLYQVLRVHGRYLGCDEQCLNDSRSASLAFLGMASVSVYLIPKILKKISSCRGYTQEEDNTTINKLVKLFVEAVKVDVLYTTLLGLGMSYGFDFDTERNQYCEKGSQAYGIITIVGCYLIAVVIVFLTYYSSKKEKEKVSGKVDEPTNTMTADVSDDTTIVVKTKLKEFDVTQQCSPLVRGILKVGFYVAFLIFLVMFTLADNHLPLEYELCKYNSSSTDHFLVKQTIFQWRSALSFLCFFIVLFVFCFVSFILEACQSYKQTSSHKSDVIE